MQILTGILIFIGWLAFVVIIRSFTTLLHELGHAIPSLLFTREKVQVFIGTYGDISDCIRFTIGRLELYFRINLFDWKLGMCRHGGIEKTWQKAVVIIGGPLASLLISISLLIIAVRYNLSDNWIVVATAFMVAAAIDFLVNINPFSGAIEMHDNSVGYSDGVQLAILLRRAGLSKEYLAAEKLYIDEQYEDAILTAEQAIDNGQRKKELYDIIVESFMKLEEYQSAINVYAEIHQYFPFHAHDYLSLGQLHLKINDYASALKFLNQHLHFAHTNAVALNDKAYANIQLANYQEALIDLDAAIHYAPNFALPYAHRGLVKMRLDYLNAAYPDLAISKQLDSKQPYAPFYLGLYFEKKGEWKNALENFLLAKELDIDHHGIDFKISEMERECLNM